MTDEVGGDHDTYTELLAASGRSEEEDERISVHEGGHILAARLLGQPLGGATIDPDASGKYGGLGWGPPPRGGVWEVEESDDRAVPCAQVTAVSPDGGGPSSQ